MKSVQLLIGLLLFPLVCYSQATDNINNTLIRKYFEQAWNQGNLEVLREVTPPEFVLHFSGKSNTANYEQHESVIKYWRGAIPDYSLTIKDILTDGNKVAARFSFTGTHRDTLLGIPPSGNTLRSTGIWICRVENTLLQECWEEYDIQRLRSQMQSSE